MANLFKTSLKSSLVMLAFGIIFTALLALTFGKTHVLIAQSEEREELALIKEVLPEGSFDNDLVHDTLEVPPSPLLGSKAPTKIFRARQGGKPVAVVMQATAPDGYGGEIKLLIAILANGEISGVRVVSHHETPGLGDYIEIAKSKWIEIFDGKSLADPAEKGWKVKKDGGDFDYMTGATVTPRAVVKAVKKALQYYGENRERLFASEGK